MNTVFRSIEGERAVLAYYDEGLRKWPVPYESYSLPTRRGRTHIIASGPTSAPALVLLHGAGSNSVFWLGDIEEYSSRFRVFALDIPGEPGKSEPIRSSYETLAYAEWLYDVIHGLKLKKTSIIGLSQGGWTALRFSAAFPDLIDKLVLMSPAGIVPTKPSFLFKAVFYSMLGRTGIKKLNRLVLGGPQADPQACEYMELIMKHVKSRFDREYIFDAHELKRLSMPVLLIGGKLDVVRSIEEIEMRLSKTLPQFHSIIESKMGHVPNGINKEVMCFLTA